MHSWIREHADVTGPIEQPHVRPWGTVLRAPTPDGPVWFKTNIPSMAYEVGVVGLLAEKRPDIVPPLLAVDLERGWMLMADAGERLREVIERERSLHRWLDVLPLYAGVQIDMAAHAEELLALGTPDHRLAVLPAKAAEIPELGDELPLIEDLCARLAAFGIPETIQHDDLHDGNVFVRDGQYVFFDWGDACVSHPFHSLTVILRAVAWRLRLEPGGRELVRLRDAYLEPFGGGDLADAADLAYHTGTIARAHAWYRFVSAREPDLRGDDAEGVPYGLKRFLAGGPIGSWE